MVNHITASCVIEKGTVYKNEKPVFHSEAGGVKEILLAIYQHTKAAYPKFYKMDNLSKLGWLAAEVLLGDRAVSEPFTAGETGVVLSNANASLDTDIRYYDTVQSMASPALFVYTLPNIVIGEICIRHHFKGENAFFVADQFDIPFMHDYVNNLLENNALQVCLCGWVDVMGEDYRAAFILVEKCFGTINHPAGTLKHTESESGYTRLFTPGIIDKIYHPHNG